MAHDDCTCGFDCDTCGNRIQPGETVTTATRWEDDEHPDQRDLASVEDGAPRVRFCDDCWTLARERQRDASRRRGGAMVRWLDAEIETVECECEADDDALDEADPGDLDGDHESALESVYGPSW